MLPITYLYNVKNSIAMKKLLFIVALFTITINSAQTWKYKAGGNAFDGKYRTAYVQGRGTDFPYNKPLLTINLFNDDLLNFYIASAGYFNSESDISILWIFNDEPNIIYKTIDFSISKDNSTIFLSSFRNTTTYEYLTRLDFINKLKSASKVDVRISDKYSDKDIIFKLSGSTKAINYVISKKYNDKIAAIIKEIELEYELKKLEEEEKKIKEKEEKEKRELSVQKITSLLDDYNLLQYEIDKVIGKIVSYSESEKFNLDSINSLNIETTKTFSAHLNLLDINDNLIYKIKFIEYGFDSFIEKLKAQRRATDSIHISSLIKSHNMSFSESNNLLKAILNSSENSIYLLSDFDSICVNLPSKFISYPNVHLFNKKNKTEKSISFANRLIPNYIKQLTDSKVNEIIAKILSLLNKYQLTKEEEIIIINNFKAEELITTKLSVLVKAVIVQNRKIPSLTKINIIDKFGKNVHSISIIDKPFYKLIKRKIGRLNLDEN